MLHGGLLRLVQTGQIRLQLLAGGLLDQRLRAAVASPHHLDDLALERDHLARRDDAARGARSGRDRNEFALLDAGFELGFDLIQSNDAHAAVQGAATQGAFVVDGFPLERPRL